MKSTILTGLLAISSVLFTRCTEPSAKTPEAAVGPTKEELVARGKYLTTLGGCNDCHTPKAMGPHGPEPDPTRMFAGHPQDEKITNVIQTSDWLVINNGFTAFVGPWGVSFAANISPDETGIKHWKLEQFITAIRKGKYKGLEDGRDLLPPMPWQMYQHMTDEDLEAVFVYLQSVPPQKNLVPSPVPPDQVGNL